MAQPKDGFAEGYVYAFAVEEMKRTKFHPLPGVFKIGCTTKHPEQRAKTAAGNGRRYSVVAYMHCKNPMDVERELHRMLAGRQHYRAPSTELFEVDMDMLLPLFLDAMQSDGIPREA